MNSRKSEATVKSTTGTLVYQRQHKRGLTAPQLSALDLLACGKTDVETAHLLGLHRTTVTKWRLYDLVFQATLNQRRTELWGTGVDKLRSLIPQALDTLGGALADEDAGVRVKAAVELLKLAQLPAGSTGIGSTDPETILRKEVEHRRRQVPDAFDDLLQLNKHLPPMAQHTEQVWQELEDRANEPDNDPEELQELQGGI